MSALLDEIIAARKTKAVEYEEYLKQIAGLVKQVETGQGGKTCQRNLIHAGKHALFTTTWTGTRDFSGTNLDRPVYEASNDPWVIVGIGVGPS
jgi:type I restriction enzyme R subunit